MVDRPGVRARPRFLRVLAVLVLTFVAMIFAGQGPASAQVPDCDISRFVTPDGVDVTGYLQCSNPTVSDTVVVPGEVITFRGGGFASNATLTIALAAAGSASATPASAALGTARVVPASFGGAELQLAGSADSLEPPDDAIVLDTTTADASGNFSVDVVIPDVPPGNYELLAIGLDPNGQRLTVALPITVAGEDGAVVGGGGGAVGDGATPVRPSGALPFTGSEVGRWVVIGVALAMFGTAAWWSSRRRHRLEV